LRRQILHSDVKTCFTVAASLLGLAAVGCRAEDPSLARAFEAGHSYAYDLKYESSAALKQAGAGAFKLGLASKLQLDVLRVRGPEIELGVAFREPQLTVNGSGEDPTLLELERDLSHPAVFVLREGKVASQRFAADISPIIVSLERSVIAAIQLPSPTSGATSWSAQELDSTGRYKAEYQLDRAESVVRKRKLAFEALLTTGKLGSVDQSKLLPKIEASSFVLGWKEGKLASVSGQEKLVTDVMGTQLVSESSLSLTGSKADPGARLVRDTVLAQTKEVSPDHAFGAAPTRGAFDKLRTDPRSFEQLIAELEGETEHAAGDLYGSKNDMPVSALEQAQRKEALGKRTGTFGALVVNLRQHSENLAKAEKLVLAESKAAPKLVDALASAGTPDAQAVLARLVQNEGLPRRLRGATATAFMLVDQPTLHTSEVLERLVDDPVLHDFGIFGIGSASRALREQGNVVRADELAKKLLMFLAEAKDDARRISVLRGIANSGYPGAVDAVRPFLTTGELDVRAAAVQALRLIQGDAVDVLVAARLTGDASSKVRLAAVKTLSRRPPSAALRQAVSSAALKESDQDVRRRIVDVLALWLPKAPELKLVLERVVREDTSPRLRELAAKALEKT
jgi:hypothetical protein